jgi:hypothetical protein
LEKIKALRNPETAKSVAVLFGPKPGAVVYLVSKGADVVTHSGGDLAKVMKRVAGQQDYSSCTTQCFALTKEPDIISLTDRKGNPCYQISTRRKGEITFQAAEFVDPGRSCSGCAGWRDVILRRGAENTWILCATAVNWEDKKTAKMFLKVQYVIPGTVRLPPIKTSP